MTKETWQSWGWHARETRWLKSPVFLYFYQGTELAVKPFQASPCTSCVILSWCLMERKNRLADPGPNSWPMKLWAMTKWLFSATEFEVACCTTADSWHMSVGFMRLVWSSLASTGLTWAHHVSVDELGLLPRLCLARAAYLRRLCSMCLASFSVASMLGRVHPSHGNDQKVLETKWTHKGSWDLGLEIVLRHFHLILLAEVPSQLNSKVKILEYRRHLFCGRWCKSMYQRVWI